MFLEHVCDILLLSRASLSECDIRTEDAAVLERFYDGHFCEDDTEEARSSLLVPRAGLKVGGPGQFLLEGSYDVIHDAMVCKSCVIAD